MTQPSPRAGGFFLILPIVLGFGLGLMTGQPMQGAVIGLGFGLVLALALWLVDRRR